MYKTKLRFVVLVQLSKSPGQDPICGPLEHPGGRTISTINLRASAPGPRSPAQPSPLLRVGFLGV